MKILKKIKLYIILRKIVIAFLLFAILYLFALSIYLKIEEVMSNKAPAKLEKKAVEFFEAYKERDLEKIAALYYPEKSKDYYKILEENKYYFILNYSEALKNPHSYDISYTFARYAMGSGTVMITVNYGDQEDGLQNNRVCLEFYNIGTNWYIAKINIFDNQDSSPPHPLRIENGQDLTTYKIKETDTINHDTFRDCKKLVEVTFPANFKNFDYSWFAECDNLISYRAEDSPYLTSIDGVLYNKDATELICYPKGKIQVKNSENGVFRIPDSVKKIRDHAFYGCIGLKRIIIPPSVKTIGDYAFSNSKSIEEVFIYDGLKSIGQQAFSFCNRLKKVTMPDSVETIDKECFWGCERLEYCEFTPSSKLTSLGYAAFENCFALKSLYLSDDLKQINNWTFQNCYSLKDLRLPENLNFIGLFAFRNCVKLEKLFISDKVTEIQKGAFYNCQKLALHIEFAGQPDSWSAEWKMSLKNPCVWGAKKDD